MHAHEHRDRLRNFHVCLTQEASNLKFSIEMLFLCSTGYKDEQLSELLTSVGLAEQFSIGSWIVACLYFVKLCVKTCNFLI